MGLSSFGLGVTSSIVGPWRLLDGVPFGESVGAFAKEGFSSGGSIHPIVLGSVLILHNCNVRAVGKWGFGRHVGDAGRQLKEARDDVDLALASVAD